MPNITINQAFKDRYFAHATMAGKLSDHKMKDLIHLGIQGRDSRNRLILECFTELPTMQELVAMKTDMDIKDIKDNTPAAVIPTPIPTPESTPTVTSKSNGSN